ncbi:MAG: hypothetical protein II119_01000 [Bacilli bacterium]|nr:hypothetical protein [Bacilli bacterium]MBQ6282777.1 hypothetical protein [Bacilli bacterium]
MILRIIFLFIGILLVVVGITSIILYLNLLSIGCSFFEYLNFIIRRLECINLIIGLIIIYITAFIGEWK